MFLLIAAAFEHLVDIRVRANKSRQNKFCFDLSSNLDDCDKNAKLQRVAAAAARVSLVLIFYAARK